MQRPLHLAPCGTILRMELVMLAEIVAVLLIILLAAIILFLPLYLWLRAESARHKKADEAYRVLYEMEENDRIEACEYQIHTKGGQDATN